jgi:rSAM/selenodomain-associated transferase 1
MARWPAPGRCKSRLAAGVGRLRAAAIQGRLCGHGMAVAAQARQRRAEAGARPLQVVLAVSGLGPRAAGRWGGALGADRVVAQGAGSLGLRMQRQVLRATREGAPGVVLIGSDLPVLGAADLLAAVAALEQPPLDQTPVVLGPAGDGGYWLIGRRQAIPQLFSGIEWGSERVLAQTLEQARRAGLQIQLLRGQDDLDRPPDLIRWR